ncbi:MAG: portal protein [Pseudomonadota bacterium]
MDEEKNGSPRQTDDEALLSEARERLQAAWEYDKHNREDALKDLRFLALDQWPEEARREREQACRPCLTLDHLNQHKNQVVNDIRQADIGIKAIPGDDQADEGVADIYTSLMRDVQYQSHADHVYAQAADNAVSCGIGHFRFNTQYVKDRVFEQELTVENIPYALAVYWDPGAVKPDRSDADYCFVTEFVPRGRFKSRFPDAREVEVDAPRENTDGFYWSSNEGVLLAEYWVKRPEKKRLVAFEDGSVIDLTDDKDGELEALAVSQLGQIQGEREAEGWRIEHHLISGAEVLHGPSKWAGQWIPIIPVIGSEVHLDKKVVRMSLIRAARDPQQLYNYWRSAAAELIALAPKSKWLVTDTQIAPYKGEWDDANTSPTPYLRYKPDLNAPSAQPTRISPPEPPAAMWQESALVTDDMKAAMGQYDASLGAQGNEVSGRAIMARQKEGDVSAYHFSDNLNRSLEHAGRVMIDLVPKIYDTQRTIRVIGEDDAQKFEQINWSVMDDATAEPVVLNDLTRGRYDVRVSIGPSYTSQRVESREALIEWMRVDPESVPMIRDLAAKTLDFEHADEMAERFKKAVPPELLPDEEQPPQQPPDPMQQQAMQMQLQEKGAEIAETEGKARKAHAEADQTELENQQMQGAAQVEQAIAQQFGGLPGQP